MKSSSQYAVAALMAATALGGCSGTAGSPDRQPGDARAVRVVAIERVYGDLASQLGGKDVTVTTILNSPTADPHEYEPTVADARAIANADVVIENGLGYDAFADKLLAASPNAARTAIVVGSLASHTAGQNPHVWYQAATLVAFAEIFARDLERRRPNRKPQIAHARLGIDAWVAKLDAHLATIARNSGGAKVAITEPVFDYVLHAAHLDIATPAGFSHAIEEGTDPAPQDVAAMHALIGGKHVAAFVYNSQTVEPSTTQLLGLAKSSQVPVVSVTETLPAGTTTQRWIDGEVAALSAALPRTTSH